jgi:hypothetical protein
MDKGIIVAAVILSVTYVGYSEYRHRADMFPDVNSQGVKDLKFRVGVDESMLQFYTSQAGTCMPTNQVLPARR